MLKGANSIILPAAYSRMRFIIIAANNTETMTAKTRLITWSPRRFPPSSSKAQIDNNTVYAIGISETQQPSVLYGDFGPGELCVPLNCGLAKFS